MNLDFNEYQKQAVSTAIYPKQAAILYPLLGLIGELGETIEKIVGDPNKIVGANLTNLKLEKVVYLLNNLLPICQQAETLKKDIRKNGLGDSLQFELQSDNFTEDLELVKKELGDQLWYIAATCRDLGISMQEVAEMNIKKLKDRQDRGVIQGSGDLR